MKHSGTDENVTPFPGKVERSRWKKRKALESLASRQRIQESAFRESLDAIQLVHRSTSAGEATVQNAPATTMTTFVRPLATLDFDRTILTEEAARDMVQKFHEHYGHLKSTLAKPADGTNS